MAFFSSKLTLLLILLLIACKQSGAQIITTYAGNGTIGYTGDGGLSVNSTLGSPIGLTEDTAGNLYIADQNNSCIRKIDTKTNVITTFPFPGLYGPSNVAIDKHGNLYVSDAGGCCIRKMDAVTKTVTVIAGIPYHENTYYNVNGRDENAPATSAWLDDPGGLAVDDSGNVYIADTNDGRVRKVDAATGLIYTVAGGAYPGLEDDSVLATDAALPFPHDLAWGPEGDLYIASYGENTVLKLNLTTHIITRVAGMHHFGNQAAPMGYTGDGGPAREAELWNPMGICFDQQGNLYIADLFNHVIRKVDTHGIITTVAGNGEAGYSGDCGLALQASLNRPWDVYVDAKGVMYIADDYNRAIRKVTPDKPNHITGSSDICMNSTIQLTNEAFNGKWESNNPSVASIDATGMVSGLSVGAAQISYTILIEGCSTTVDNHLVTVHNVSDANAERETIDVCKGSLFLLQKQTDNGVWTSSNNSIADVDTSSLLHGINAGNAFLQYTVSATCSINQIVSLNVHELPAVFLGNDTSFCANTPLTLNAGANRKSYQWSTGDTTQYKSIRNAGFYSVTVTDANNCKTSDTIRIVQIYTLPYFNWTTATVLCGKDSLILTVPSDMQAIEWQDGSAGASYTINQPGVYWASVKDKNGCRNSDTLTINQQIKQPEGGLPKDTTLCSYQSLLLAPSASFISYHWSTGETNSSITIHKSGVYEVQVEDKYECYWQLSTKIFTKDCYSAVRFPTAFSPDGNGLNDVFKPKVFGSLTSFRMELYNRWGQKVFESTDAERGWSGTVNGMQEPNGTYIWNVVYQLAGGNRTKESGLFVLIR